MWVVVTFCIENKINFRIDLNFWRIYEVVA